MYVCVFVMRFKSLFAYVCMVFVLGSMNIDILFLLCSQRVAREEEELRRQLAQVEEQIRMQKAQAIASGLADATGMVVTSDAQAVEVPQVCS